MKHILIVGAGPVGLFLAIQINKLSPEYKIDIWEKKRYLCSGINCYHE